MSDDKASAPNIPLDSELRKVLPLNDKLVVELVNGLDVARDHLRVQTTRSGFRARLVDGVTGSSGRRQRDVNARLVDGLEASFQWLQELSREVALSNFAIQRVNDRVTALTCNMAALAKYSGETRMLLLQFQDETRSRWDKLNQEVARIGLLQAASLQMELVLSDWAGGKYLVLAPAQRCYAVLEALRWGRFGEYVRQLQCYAEDELVRTVINRVSRQLADDVRVEIDGRCGMTDTWLASPGKGGEASDLLQALEYMADGLTIESAPFVVCTVRHPDELVDAVPRIACASRVASAIQREVFKEKDRV